MNVKDKVKYVWKDENAETSDIENCETDVLNEVVELNFPVLNLNGNLEENVLERNHFNPNRKILIVDD